MTPYHGPAFTIAAVERFTIGKLAAAAGVNIETVRYYERRGLLPQPQRSAGGYRQYDHDDLERLRFVARAKQLGFTLSEIAELTAGDGDDVARVVLDAARAKLEAVQRRQTELAELRDRLERLVGTCEGGPQADCASLRVTA